jgi:hypothetical protein
MAYSRARAVMEDRLAAAHRALHTAASAAEEMHDDGAAEDIYQILKEVSRVAEASLRDKPRRSKIKGQLEIPA